MTRKRLTIVSAAAALAAALSVALVATAQRADADTTVIQDTDQGTGAGQVEFSANWNVCTTNCTKAPDNSFRWTSTVNSTATVRFTGNQITLFGVKEPWSNIATVAIDGGPTVDVDFYANPATSSVVRVYSSPTLTEGSHTLVMTMTSRRNPASGGGSAITFDRAEIISGGQPTPSSAPCTLASQGDPATASSVQSGTTHVAANAVDGNTSTRWSSNFSDPQWIRVDLGTVQPICRVVLTWETAYASAYQIQTSSDGASWTTVLNTTTGDGGVDDLAVSGAGRYVRIYGTARGTQYGYSLWELQIYSGSGTTPTSTPPPPPPPPPLAPALSGAAVYNPYAFGTWRGTPVQIWETWNNFATWSQMEAISPVHTYFTGEGSAPFNVRFPGALSFAQPMWASGENANTCNSGANDAHMRNIFTNLRNAWGNNAWIRLGWEMDGYWFPQNYAPSNPTGWVNCWRRWHGIIKSVDPNFKLVWNPNWNSNTNGQGSFDVRTVWPGDPYVDAAGPDYYDFNINPNATGFNGAPVGINQWLAFVASHNKPFASPEWGLDTPSGGVDDVSFIQQMFDAFQTAKNSSSGLAYESYFNLDGCVFQITDGCNPNAGARYQQLF